MKGKGSGWWQIYCHSTHYSHRATVWWWLLWRQVSAEPNREIEFFVFWRSILPANWPIRIPTRKGHSPWMPWLSGWCPARTPRHRSGHESGTDRPPDIRTGQFGQSKHLRLAKISKIFPNFSKIHTSAVSNFLGEGGKKPLDCCWSGSAEELPDLDSEHCRVNSPLTGIPWANLAQTIIGLSILLSEWTWQKPRSWPAKA